MANPKNEESEKQAGPFDSLKAVRFEVKVSEEWMIENKSRDHIFLAPKDNLDMYLHLTAGGLLYVSNSEASVADGGSSPMPLHIVGRPDWEGEVLFPNQWEHWDYDWPTHFNMGKCPRVDDEDEEIQ